MASLAPLLLLLQQLLLMLLVVSVLLGVCVCLHQLHRCCFEDPQLVQFLPACCSQLLTLLGVLCVFVWGVDVCMWQGQAAERAGASKLFAE